MKKYFNFDRDTLTPKEKAEIPVFGGELPDISSVISHTSPESYNRHLAGSLDKDYKFPDCPYNRHIGAVPPMEGAPFTTSPPRKHRCKARFTK